MTLARYIARRFAAALLGTLGVFAAILILADMIEQLRRLDGTGAGLPQAAELALLAAPGNLYRILPLIAAIAAIAAFLGLARRSELVVVRSAGRSALAALRAPVLVALAFGALAVAVLNPLVAATSARYELLSDRYQAGEESVISLSREGLWLRQGDADGQTVIRARRASLDGTRLADVSFVAFDAGGAPIRRIEAERAALGPGAWALEEAKLWRLGAANPEAEARRAARMDVPTDLTAGQIRDSFGDPASVSIWDLPAFIRALTSAGFSAAAHRMWLQSEIAAPAFLAGMAMLGAAFSMGHARMRRTGLLVLSAMLAAFALFFLRGFAQVLGENGQVPILLAAWAPPLATIALAAGILLNLEER